MLTWQLDGPTRLKSEWDHVITCIQIKEAFHYELTVKGVHVANYSTCTEAMLAAEDCSSAP